MIDDETLGNVAGSPNDLLLFFNHHTMINCLFQPWLEHQPSTLCILYSLANNFPLHLYTGHGPQHCMVPFFPPHTPMKTCLSIALIWLHISDLSILNQALNHVNATLLFTLLLP